MADLVKSVLGGAWSLIIGWILPTYISFQLIAVLVLPGMREFKPVSQFFQFSSPARQFALLAAAAVAGLVLAAAQAPLYRILEDTSSGQQASATGGSRSIKTAIVN